MFTHLTGYNKYTNKVVVLKKNKKLKNEVFSIVLKLLKLFINLSWMAIYSTVLLPPLKPSGLLD